MSWTPFNHGETVGTPGSEGGVTRRDEEHALGARITLEQGTSHAPWAITCGVYGWMFHTRFLGDAERARCEYDAMKLEIEAILCLIPCTEPIDPDQRLGIHDALDAFVRRFP